MPRTRHAAATAAAVLLLALTAACGSDDSGSQPQTEESAPASQEGPATPSPAKPMKLGETAETAADDGASTIQVTPDTLVYAEEGTGETPDNDTFAVVAYKADNASDNPAAITAPAGGGGWTWIAPDGQAIGAGDGNAAFNVTPDGFLGGGDIPARSYDWQSAVFDLTNAQKGGTLSYMDGAGVEHRWVMSKQDDGEQIDKLKKGLEF